jgi:hypothetical protein
MSDVELTTNVTLNGETLDVTVYEDVGDDGTTDNQQTVSGVANGTNTYALSTLDGGRGNAYWTDLSLSSASDASSPVVHSMTLDVPVAGPLVLLSGNAVLQTSNGVLDTE